MVVHSILNLDVRSWSTPISLQKRSSWLFCNSIIGEDVWTRNQNVKSLWTKKVNLISYFFPEKLATQTLIIDRSTPLSLKNHKIILVAVLYYPSLPESETLVAHISHSWMKNIDSTHVPLRNIDCTLVYMFIDNKYRITSNKCPPHSGQDLGFGHTFGHNFWSRCPRNMFNPSF